MNRKPCVARGWGGGFFWKSLRGRNFVAPGLCGFVLNKKETKGTEGREGGILKSEEGKERQKDEELRGPLSLEATEETEETESGEGRRYEAGNATLEDFKTSRIGPAT